MGREVYNYLLLSSLKYKKRTLYEWLALIVTFVVDEWLWLLNSVSAIYLIVRQTLIEQSHRYVLAYLGNKGLLVIHKSDKPTMVDKYSTTSLN